MLKFFRLPFATGGDKTAVPDAVDSNGNVSYSQGYGFDYQRQKTDPAAKNIERDKMNQVLFDITTAIAEIQSKGGADFITSALNGGTAYSYSQNAIVNYGGAWYISLVAANTALPSDATKWALLPTPALLQQAAFMSANAAGTVDAITAAFSPAIAALPAAPGTLSVFVRASGANATTTPTFKADGTTAKTIVKGNNLPLAPGDIAGAGMWLELQYDATLDKWVLQNPAGGITSQMGGLKNLLINSNFSINQRAYVSGAATGAANQYTLDRWRVVTSGQNLSWTSAGNTFTATAPAGGIEQVVEANNISGGTYCLSWTGTATATINGTAVANGGTIALTGGNNATVKFSGGTVARAQLEKASAPTAYEDRLFGVELTLCQRYYESGVANWVAQLGGSTTNGNTYCYYSHQIFYKVKKRASPTLTKTTPPANPYVPFVGAISNTDALLLTNAPYYVGQIPSSQNAFSLTWTADAEF